MKACLLPLMISLLLSGCGMSAGERQQAGYAALLSDNDEAAFAHYRDAAAAEQPEARYRLAQLYLEGRGTTQNTAEAIVWLQRLSTHRESHWQTRAHQLLGEIYAGDHDSAFRERDRAAQHFAACSALGNDACVRRQALLIPPQLPPAAVTGPLIPVADLYEEYAPAVYKVVVYERLGAGLEPLSLGSAVAIDPYRAVTSQHLLAAGGVPVSIRRDQAQTVVREADILVWRVLYTDPARDLALLALEEGPRLDYIRRARVGDDVQVGERVFAIGSPAGLDKTLTEGIVSARRSQDGVRVLQTTAPISYGSSGGGLFDERGNLLGITTKGVSAWGNFNFAVAADEVQAFLAESAGR